jgi:hypothetical protein
MTAGTPAAPAATTRGRGPLLLALAAIGLGAAILGAWLDWLWWPVYSGIVITLAAVALLIVGAILAVIPRRRVRRSGFVLLVIAAGLVLGQVLGPSREELVVTEGTMTLTLTSPTSEASTIMASCSLVPSGTEFAISGDPNMRLSDGSFVSIYINTGNRWEVLRDVPRTNGVHFQISVMGQLVTGDKPTAIGMESVPTSTIDATFTNDGGRVEFADLAPMTGVDYSGGALDLAGTVEWTCGPPG